MIILFWWNIHCQPGILHYSWLLKIVVVRLFINVLNLHILRAWNLSTIQKDTVERTDWIITPNTYVMVIISDPDMCKFAIWCAYVNVESTISARNQKLPHDRMQALSPSDNKFEPNHATITYYTPSLAP